ncbi:MAG: GDP-mannose 4,6-dehydratase [Ignavibacteriae bacterium]|nr:GDP-mannose 4,6-dehydratase [Ignavibacteriota bacterium]
MNVLVTGIDGFVGSHLAEALLKLPAVQLFGIVRDQSSLGHIEHIKEKITCIECDITSSRQVEQTIASVRPSKIFHLAGQAFVPFSKEHPYETFQVNIMGVVNILEAVHHLSSSDRASCSVLVVGSAEVYGAVPVDRLPIEETMPLNPANPYAASKACADLLAQQYRTAFNLDVVVVRPFNHLGPRQSELFVGSALAKQIAEIKIGKSPPTLLVGNIDPERDFTDVRDVVQAYIMLLNAQRSHAVYNVSSQKAISIRELIHSLCETGGVNVNIVLDKNRQRANDIPKILGSAQRLRLETGWRPQISLQETLRDLLRYWEERVG